MTDKAFVCDTDDVKEATKVGTHPAHEAAELDEAGKFLAEIQLRPDANILCAPWTPEEERKVVRRADCIIVPLLFLGVMMGAVDKNALGTAAIMGLREDLGLKGQEYSWTSSLIFFGSIVSLFPSLFAMQRFRAARVISGCVIMWGILSMCIAATKNFAGLAVCRFVLGIFEALTFPGFSLVISSWWTRKEQVARVAIIYSTVSTLTNGLLSFACSFVPRHSRIEPWQLLFLVVGAVTFVLGIMMAIFLPDSPVRCWWLTDRQKVIAVSRLKANQTGVENKVFKLYQVKEAVLDVKTWLIFVINVCLNIPNGGVNTFNSIIVASLGFNVRQTTLLNCPTGLISWTSSLFFSYIAVKTCQRTLTAFVACFIPLLSTILLHVIPRSNRSGSLGSLFIIYVYWAPYTVLMTSVIANTAGYTKKTVAYGCAYLGYLVGNIVGPQTFRASQAPTYSGGIAAMLAGYCIGMVLIIIYFLNIIRLNRRNAKWRDNQVPQDEEETDEWLDQTDFEQKGFRYEQ